MSGKFRESVDLVTQNSLKERMEYDPETGIFKWLIPPLRSSAGDVAGRPNTNGYLEAWLFGKRYLLHRLAFLYMDGDHPASEIDHIDGCRTNNAWSNLRRVSNAENSRNLKIFSNNKSGASGVHYDRSTGEWVASIRSGGKLIRIGSYGLKFFAKQARLAAEKKYGYHENHGKR
ncbi:HNH endonuclease [Pseudomonas sp. R4-84]